jgi:5-methylcytosine-specific restriction protein A
MKLEIILFGATGFILYNMYHENKYIKIIWAYKKFYQMALIAFLSICLYLMIRRNPSQTKNLLLYTNNMIKYMPIDKGTTDMISPIFDLTTKDTTPFMETLNRGDNCNSYDPTIMSQQQRNQYGGHAPGKRIHKRAVSETKKKYVASMQDWKCNQCCNKLTHTFEIDHRVRLESGGSNDVSNLVALCRECHGQKTAMENM